MLLSVNTNYSNHGNYSNYTLYGIHNKAERQFLAGYNTLILMSSLVGDTLILTGSSKYQAINLHPALVILIQNIAVADLLFACFRVLPSLVSLQANQWILGNFLCDSGYLVGWSAGGAVCLLISALSLTKLLIVRYPFRAQQLTNRAAHFTSFTIWVLSTLPPVTALVLHESVAGFSYRDYSCVYTSSLELLGYDTCIIYCTLMGVLGLSSSFITAGSSLALLLIARRAARKDQKQREGSRKKQEGGGREQREGSRKKPQGGGREQREGSRKKPQGGGSKEKGGSRKKQEEGGSKEKGGSRKEPQGGGRTEKEGSRKEPQGGGRTEERGSRKEPQGGGRT